MRIRHNVVIMTSDDPASSHQAWTSFLTTKYDGFKRFSRWIFAKSGENVEVLIGMFICDGILERSTLMIETTSINNEGQYYGA